MAPGQRAPATGSLNLEQAGHLHGRSKDAAETGGLQAELSPTQRSRTPYRDKFRTGAWPRLAVFFSEKPFEIDAADGCGGVIKAAAKELAGAVETH